MKSSQVEDPSVRPFASPSFNHIDYLNSVLPPFAVSTSSQNAKQPDNKPSLAETSAKTQTLLSHLSANTTRMSDTLTQLTDEIIRGGSRLAYEVEVLRGDTIGLSEALTEGLSQDIKKFVLRSHTDKSSELADDVKDKSVTQASHDGEVVHGHSTSSGKYMEDPPYVSQLRTLSTVKDRLEAVVKVFGEAMEWALSPSEVSVTSSFISVSAPEPGLDTQTLEKKGQESAKRLREEILALLSSESSREASLEAAKQRVQQLQNLAQIWKGTAEEKARSKFVDGLAKLVEDHERIAKKEAEESEALRSVPRRVRTMSPSKHAGAGEHSNGLADFDETGRSTKQGGYGFMDHFQRMRNGL